MTNEEKPSQAEGGDEGTEDVEVQETDDKPSQAEG